MNRYLAFAGDYYYPGGGWTDLIGSYASVAEAKAQIERSVSDGWGHVVDTQAGVIVAEGDKDYVPKWEWTP